MVLQRYKQIENDFESNNPEAYLQFIETMLHEEYNYPLPTIERELKFADISCDIGVFLMNKPHIIENLYIVCDNSKTEKEFKHKFISLLAKSKSLKYGIYCKAGDYTFYKRKNNAVNLEEHFGVPVFNSTHERLVRGSLKATNDIFKVFEVIHNHIYANEGYSSLEVFNEMIKIIFMKLEDEKKGNNELVEFYITEKEYEDIVSKQISSFEARIYDLFHRVRKNNQDTFSKNDELNLKLKTLAFIVGQLQYFDLANMDNDVKGLAFQKFIYNNQKGERGQFFTPDPVVVFMVKLVKPTVACKFIDPACGTGGFIWQVINYIKNRLKSTGVSREEINKQLQAYINDNIRGIEINPTTARVPKMRMIFENYSKNNIVNCNALDDWNEIFEQANSSGTDLESNSFDLILTNPPFGSQGKIEDYSVLERFALGYKWGKYSDGYIKTAEILKKQVPDILFIERCIDLLKDYGKLGIVLPNGDLENPSLAYVRSFILSKCKVLAIVKLPEQTFTPFGTGVKASILFVQKLPKADLLNLMEADYKIFFGIITKLGYSFSKNGSSVFKRNDRGDLLFDEHDVPRLDEDYTEILEHYERFEQGEIFADKPNSYIRNFSDLKDRQNPDYHKPEFYNNIVILKKNHSVPLKSIAKILKGTSKILKNPENIVKYIEISDVNPLYSTIIAHSELAVYELPSRATYEVKSGDIITSVAGNSIGSNHHATALVTQEYDGAICTNGFRVIKAVNVNPFYLLSYFRSKHFLYQILQLRTGAAIPAVSDSDLENILVYLPSELEQLKIGNEFRVSFETLMRVKNNFSQNLYNEILKL